MEATPSSLIQKLDKGIGILKKVKPPDRIVCKLCQLVVSRLDVERHVYGHVGAEAPLFSCGHCTFVGAHVKNHHSSRHYGLDVKIVDNRPQHAPVLVQTWNQCFGDKFKIKFPPQLLAEIQKETAKVAPKQTHPVCRDTSINYTARTWTENIHVLVNNLRSKTVGNFLYCKLCRSSLRKSDNRKIYIHVLTHFREPIFACTLCCYKGNHILPHMRTNHRGKEGQFSDRLSEMEGKILDMCQKCFGEKTEPAEPEEHVVVQEVEMECSCFCECMKERVIEMLENGVNSFSCKLCGENFEEETVERMAKILELHVLAELDKNGPSLNELFESSSKTWKEMSRLQQNIKIEMIERCF